MTKTRPNRNNPFPLSGDRTLRLQNSLLKTLAINLESLALCDDPDGNKCDFVRDAQRTWSTVFRKVQNGELNGILWLRGLLHEARGQLIWIPPIFLKRLRQLERSELVMQNRLGPISLAPHAGLPDEFRACCEFMGWKFPHIVPGLSKEEFVDVRGPCDTPTTFVKAVVDAWKDRPTNLSGGRLRAWLRERLAAR